MIFTKKKKNSGRKDNDITLKYKRYCGLALLIARGFHAIRKKEQRGTQQCIYREKATRNREKFSRRKRKYRTQE